MSESEAEERKKLAKKKYRSMNRWADTLHLRVMRVENLLRKLKNSLVRFFFLFMNLLPRSAISFLLSRPAAVAGDGW